MNHLLIPMSLALFAAPLAAQIQPQVEHAYVAFGSGIGEAGFVPSTAPGQNEFYLDGSFGAFWHTLRHDPGSGQYVQTYVSPEFGSDVIQIEVANVLPSAGDEILVLTEDGLVRVYHQSDKSLLAMIDTGLNSVRAMDLADFNADGLDDFAITDQGALHLLTNNGTLIQSFPGNSGQDVVIGQMDGDPSLEVAVSNGYVIDVLSGLVQCTWVAGFGFDMGVSDFDGDGMQELIFVEFWNFAWAFDVDTCLPKWSIPMFNNGAMQIADVDMDGTDELLIGEAQWGDILCFDLSTQAQLWSLNNPEHGCTYVQAADTDGDGTKEIIWGAGASSSGEDIMYIADWSTQIVEWESIDLRGPFAGPVVGDLDGDGLMEVVTVSSESDSGYGAGKLVVLRTSSYLPDVSQEVARSMGWTGIHDIKLHDVDGDGDMEIMIAAGTTYDGLLEIYDYAPGGVFTLIWDNNTLPNGATFYSVDAADIDQDGQLEIIGGVGAEHTGSTGTFLYAYDYATGNEEWHSLQMGGFWDAITDVAIADLDQDGALEIAGMVEGGDIYIFDGVTKTLEAIEFGSHSCMEAVVVGTSTPILLTGDNTGTLRAVYHDGTGYSVVRTFSFGSGEMDGFKLLPGNKIAIGSGGVLSLYPLVSGASPIWSSDHYGVPFGSQVEFVSDGFVTGGSNGVYHFGY